MQERINFKVDFQVHLHRGNYSLRDVLQKMEQKGLKGIAVLSHPHENYLSRWFLRTRKGEYSIDEDTKIIKARNRENGGKFYLFLGQEIESSGGFHLLDIGRISGYRSDARKPLEAYIEEGLADNRILIFDHPYADPTRKFADLEPEKEKELIKIAEKYGQEIAFEWNAYSLPYIRALMPGYGNVNKKLERFASEYGLRIIPTSDTHVRNKKLLNGIGTAHVSFPDSVDFSDENIYTSIKDKILKDNYDAHKSYVSFLH
ncbi:hypothetical protein B6U80_01750, partial [Candidatus Pacearchaeota archaeon ex4484_26]